MNELVNLVADWGAGVLELMGMVLILVIAVYSVGMASLDLLRGREGKKIYQHYRHILARGILFGLELLVAADIIKTVTFNLNFYNVGVLAIIILIRSFLSFTLNLEASGRWPWQTE